MISATPPAHKVEALRILNDAVGRGVELSSLMRLLRKALLAEEPGGPQKQS